MDKLAGQWRNVENAALNGRKRDFKREHEKLVVLIEKKEKEGLTPEQINALCFGDPE